MTSPLLSRRNVLLGGLGVAATAALAPVFHDGADDGIAAWGESMTVRGYDVGPAGAAGLRFSGS